MKARNRSTLALAVVLLTLTPVVVSAADAADPVAPTGRMELFNGKDFTGWTFFMTTNAEPSRTWTVTNGVIHCTGRPNGYIRTLQAYRDYKITLEWRFVKVAGGADNTGLLLHVQPPDKVWPKSIECQGQHRHQGDFILIGGTAIRGQEPTPTFRRVSSTEPANEKPVGEWNTYEVVAAGDTMKVFVNGKLMNEAAGCSVSSGTIAIQSEGGELEVRRVALEPAKNP